MKYLSKEVPCTLFSLSSPRWNGNSARREVGLAQYRITEHNEIHFTYRRKRGPTAGQLSIPDVYYFDGSKLDTKDYERQMVGAGTVLVIVPFDDLEVLTRQKPVRWITETKDMPMAIAEIFFSEDSAQVTMFKE